ncbi:type III-B CRISPR module RAMP protein Cmr6 [bacterium]|nr:type III-B CRISPR module RAMP protein Cmr6 [bacterium]
MAYPVLNPTTEALKGWPTQRRHPGLLTDTYVPYANDQFGSLTGEDAKKHLTDISRACNSFQNTQCGGALLAGWSNLTAAAGAKPEGQWTMSTVWRLAAHLSRPTGLENAALCLHPIYGFPYLPGTGLKGLATAYADSMGVGESDPSRRRIMGTTSAGGSVVFLEAWPAQWPKVEVDIVNSHHREYYNPSSPQTPGDWENPNMVYFLTVAPEERFRFALAKAHPASLDDDVQTARKWLVGGLTELGFGAKTAAGYGYFTCDGETAKGPPTAADPPLTPLEALERWADQFLEGSPQINQKGTVLCKLNAYEGETKRAAAALLLRKLKDLSWLDKRSKSNPDKPSLGGELRAAAEGE